MIWTFFSLFKLRSPNLSIIVCRAGKPFDLVWVWKMKIAIQITQVSLWTKTSKMKIKKERYKTESISIVCWRHQKAVVYLWNAGDEGAWSSFFLFYEKPARFILYSLNFNYYYLQFYMIFISKKYKQMFCGLSLLLKSWFI